MNTTEVLALKFKCDDLARTLTIREWLIELLATLWAEEESFSGKRPFGNSGWQWDVAPVLIKNKVVKGELDEDGYVAEVDDEQLRKTIADAIQELGRGGPSNG